MHIMIRHFFLILLVCIVEIQASSQEWNIEEKPHISYYLDLNEQEFRLSEYKDDNVSLMLKLEQLERINAFRKKHGVQPLLLDIFACRLANKISKESAEHSYTSHWNLRGEKPYVRNAINGGTNHIFENAYGVHTSGAFEQNLTTIRNYMKEAHNAFIEERKPHDAHKRNTLDPYHNYVGLGYYLTENHFSYYEEYLDVYLDVVSKPDTVNVNETFRIQFRIREPWYLYFIHAYYEDFPDPKSTRKLNRLGSYNDYGKKSAFMLFPWEVEAIEADQIHYFTTSFDTPGLYYFQVFLDKKKISPPKSINTEGKLQASGIVVFVRP